MTSTVATPPAGAHPREVLRDFFDKRPGSYSFSIYEPTGGSGDEERRRSRAGSETPWTWEIPAGTAGHMEAGLDSICQISGSGRPGRPGLLHIPQIDFKISPASFAPGAEFCGESGGHPHEFLAGLLEEATMGPPWVFESGASYHAYFDRLISPESWIRFMGHLLVINAGWCTRHIGDLIDTGWVGRSLMRGYSTLRWTAKNRGPIRFVPASLPDLPTYEQTPDFGP